MPHDSWQDAVADILEATRTITGRQQELAVVAGIDLPIHLPRLVASVRLQTALGAEVGFPAVSTAPCSDAQWDLISSLETKDRPTFLPLNWREANAWIYYLRLKNRQGELEKLQVEAGDIVQVIKPGGGPIEEVSSIGGDGRIYFKGGAGAGAWPDMIVFRCKKHDDSTDARELRADPKRC